MKVLALTAQTDLPEAHLLRRLAEEGVSVTVGSLSGNVRKEALLGPQLAVEELGFPTRFHPPAMRKLRRLVIRERFDIVHYFSARALSNGLLALRGLPCKHVAYRGTMGHLSRLDPSSWLSFLNPSLDGIICVSEAVRGYLLKKGLPPSKLFTIHKGHELSWYSVNALSRETIGVPQDSFVVALAANMRRVKGAHVLLEALKLIDTNLPIHTVLIGEVRDSLVARQIRELQPKGKLHHLGFRSDVSSIVAAADTFVMPSIAREGLPKAVIEAMALGVPPIVSNVGGMPELVENEVSGLVVPPSDPTALARAILALYESKDKRRRFAVAAQARIREHFSLEKTLRLTLQVYQKLLSS